jgi:hypothetical protein
LCHFESAQNQVLLDLQRSAAIILPLPIDDILLLAEDIQSNPISLPQRNLYS